jgi:hypothetical protein
MMTFAAAAGILAGLGSFAMAISYNSQIVDSSVGKSPYLVMASAAGGLEVLGGWDSVSRSFRGKRSSVILFEGPPPRRAAAFKVRDSSAGVFDLYTDRNAPGNHFESIGYMGDRLDVKADLKSTADPADGATCVRISYAPSDAGEQGWAGFYWLDPRSNWGSTPSGYNLTGMTQLTFWARGAKGGEQIAVFKVGGVTGRYSDTGTAEIGPVWLTKEWKQYVIDLRDVDLSKISGGFAWSTAASDNAGPIAFYLDEIRYER